MKSRLRINIGRWYYYCLVDEMWHDDVIKWKHFPRNWPFVRGIHRSPVNSSHKGQWRGALIFILIWASINGWVNNCETGDLRRNRPHYDVIVMDQPWKQFTFFKPNLETDLHLYCQNIEAGTKWPPIHRRHFQAHFLEWKFFNFE